MNCYKCGKDMDNHEGDYTMPGVTVQVTLDDEQKLNPATIDYMNKQLGKYGHGMGGCDVAICYECHIDNQFRVSRHD